MHPLIHYSKLNFIKKTHREKLLNWLKVTTKQAQAQLMNPEKI